jgi:ubiquinone/menaquinone biosynthesis C-methylase UbiE
VAERVCPWWVGYLLASPIRKLFENPRKILGEYVKPGKAVLDVGCAMGFFSLWSARTVGPEGKVYALDLQPRMINSLKRRAKRAGLSDRIDTRICGANGLGIDDLNGRIDFAFAIHVVHEVPDPDRLMAEIFASLKANARMLILEPKGHVSDEGFEATKTIAEHAGFKFIKSPPVRRARSALFVK